MRLRATSHLTTRSCTPANFRGASGTALVSALGAILIGGFQSLPVDLGYYLTVAIMCGMAYGVYNQRHQAQILATELSRHRVCTGAEEAESFDWFSRSQKP